MQIAQILRRKSKTRKNTNRSNLAQKKQNSEKCESFQSCAENPSFGKKRIAQILRRKSKARKKCESLQSCAENPKLGKKTSRPNLAQKKQNSENANRSNLTQENQKPEKNEQIFLRRKTETLKKNEFSLFKKAKNWKKYWMKLNEKTTLRTTACICPCRPSGKAKACALLLPSPNHRFGTVGRKITLPNL
jgi:hypothetical protein